MMLASASGGVAMTNCFLVGDEISKQVVLFDAPDHTTTALLDETAERGWDLIGLWLTHGHFDHFADHVLVKQRFPNAKILIHPLDEPKAQNPDLQTSLFGLSLAIPPLRSDGYVADNQKLKLGSSDVIVIHTPGHAPGHVAYHFPAENLLIGGDLIMEGSVGRTDLPDSDHAALEASIRRIMELPPKTCVLCGHGSPTTLENESKHNPFVQEALQHSARR